MNVHEHIENHIELYLQEEGVNHKGLYDDLFDHLYLEVEHQLQYTKDIDEAWATALEMVCPDGAQIIQKDLIQLTTINYRVMMHRIIFTIGGLGGLIILLSLTGFVGELIDLTFTRQLIMFGLLIITLSVYPYSLVKWYKKSRLQLEG